MKSESERQRKRKKEESRSGWELDNLTKDSVAQLYWACLETDGKQLICVMLLFSAQQTTMRTPFNNDLDSAQTYKIGILAFILSIQANQNTSRLLFLFFASSNLAPKTHQNSSIIFANPNQNTLNTSSPLSHHLSQINLILGLIGQQFYQITVFHNSFPKPIYIFSRLLTLEPPHFFQEFLLYFYSNLIRTTNVQTHDVSRINLKQQTQTHSKPHNFVRPSPSQFDSTMQSLCQPIIICTIFMK